MNQRTTDQRSIVDDSPASHPAGVVVSGATRVASPSVSAQIAAVTAHPPKASETHPSLLGEDCRHSLAEMACGDLDAALQLLAERAQYITGASGAAIALRRGEHNDMLCRASAGWNAPELGSLLSMEYGLSGESVRKRQAMCCDDAERDPRVNREGCRRLGISSVVVMPIVSDEQALGVFELFSGKPRAFDERDLSALQRLSQMIEIAVKYAAAAHTTLLAQRPPALESQSSADVAAVESSRFEPATNPSVGHSIGRESVQSLKAPPPQIAETIASEKLNQKEAGALKKPLFWTAAIQRQGSSGSADSCDESIAVPLVLRNLQKCQACGFPVSQGRTLCVECEEKQWRGPSGGRQAVRKKDGSEVATKSPGVALLNAASPAQPSSRTGESTAANLGALAAAAGVAGTQNSTLAASDSAVVSDRAPVPVPTDLRLNVAENISKDVPLSDSAAPFLSSAVESKSWFAANKYILGALLVVAVVIGAIAWLH
jgi:hypothetical protein